MKKSEIKQAIIDKLIEQIEKDILFGDTTVLDELLHFLPMKYLRGALTDEGEDMTFHDPLQEAINDQKINNLLI